MKTSLSGFHLSHDVKTVVEWTGTQVDRFDYTFENFYHPLVGELIKLVNERSVAEMLDPTTLEQLAKPFFDTDYKVNPSTNDSVLVEQPYPQKEIDVDIGGPYANYNWELFYHIPVAMGVHLSQNHRYAEAQRWFGLVFDPASTEDDPQRYWKFLYFRQHSPWQTFKLLSTPDAQLTATELKNKKSVLAGYDAGMKHPFMPHVVARMRPTAYQYYVVMAYLDNLIAWGDSLFAQFTPETVPQALLCYIQAANLLGPRPMELPPAGTSKPMSFNDLKNAQLDELGDAIVELEAQFPFDGAPAAGNGGDGSASSLFGIARTQGCRRWIRYRQHP